MAEGMGDVKKYVAGLEEKGAGLKDGEVSFDGETEKVNLTEAEVSQIAEKFLKDPVIRERVEELIRSFKGNHEEKKSEVN